MNINCWEINYNHPFFFSPAAYKLFPLDLLFLIFSKDLSIIHTISSTSAGYGNVFPFLLFLFPSKTFVCFSVPAFLAGHSLHLIEASDVVSVYFVLLQEPWWWWWWWLQIKDGVFFFCFSDKSCHQISAATAELCSMSWVHTLTPFKEPLFTNFQATLLPKGSVWNEQMLRSCRYLFFFR